MLFAPQGFANYEDDRLLELSYVKLQVLYSQRICLFFTGTPFYFQMPYVLNKN